MSLKQEMKLNQGLNQYSFRLRKIKIQNGSIIYIAYVEIMSDVSLSGAPAPFWYWRSTLCAPWRCG